MQVRPATPDDARAIAGVHVRSWQAAYRGIIADAVLDAITVDDRERSWNGYLTDADNLIRTLVADDGGTVVGFVSLRDRYENERTVAEIPALYVDPSVWRTGVGRALMAAALDELRATGAEAVVLWVLEENAGGRAFYSACGFAPDGGRKTNELGPQEIRVRLSFRR